MIAGTAVELVPYDPAWPEDFERIRDKLERLLTPCVTTIEHIGSTSVPGLAAKPLIDIDIVLRGSADIPLATRILLEQGYEPRGNRHDDEVGRSCDATEARRNASISARRTTGHMSGE